MKKLSLSLNLPSIMFSISLFLFAVSPAFEKIKIMDYIVWAFILLCGTIAIIGCIVLMVKEKRNFFMRFISNSKFSFFDIASSLLGLIISYSFNSHLVKVWIFFLVLNVVNVLIPNPFKRQQHSIGVDDK